MIYLLVAATWRFFFPSSMTLNTSIGLLMYRSVIPFTYTTLFLVSSWIVSSVFFWPFSDKIKHLGNKINRILSIYLGSLRGHWSFPGIAQSMRPWWQKCSCHPPWCLHGRRYRWQSSGWSPSSPRCGCCPPLCASCLRRSGHRRI